MRSGNENVIVRQSKIHGRGVFARRDIPCDTRVIEYVGDKITKAESERRADAVLQRSKNKGTGAVYIFQLNKRHDIDGNVAWNPARYINHACETNCESDIIRGHIWIVATKDIKKGEELFYDYGFNLDNWEDHPCCCSSSECIGYIVEKSLRKRLKKKIATKKAASSARKK